MSIRNTIIAIVLVIIIGGYALVMRLYSRPLQTDRLFHVKPAAITAITLKYPSRELEIVRDGKGKWNIVAPIKVAADQVTANNLARAIADATIKRSFKASPADLKNYGLKPPAVIVTARTAAKTLPSIDVGKTTPVGFSAYLVTSDKPDLVKLTSSAFPSGMKKTVSDLRDRTLMTFKTASVTRLILEHQDGPTIEVDKGKAGGWEIVKPARYKADPTQVRQVLDALAQSRIVDFVADTPAEVSQYGLNRPRLTALVSLKGAPDQSLLFGFKQSGNGKDGVYVRRGESTPVYTVHSFVVNEVDKTVFDLRDKTMLSFKPSAVARVAVTDSSGSFALARAPVGKWTIAVGAGKAVPADVAVCERILEQVQDLKGMTIVADPMKNAATYGMNKPGVTIALTAKDGKPIGQVRLAKVKTVEVGAAQRVAPFTYYATSSTGTAVYTVDAFTYNQLDKSPVEFGAPARPHAPVPVRAAK